MVYYLFQLGPHSFDFFSFVKVIFPFNLTLQLDFFFVAL